jgi:allantoinase
MKVDGADPGDLWKAKAGFGGTEYMLPSVFSEGTKRGLSPNRIAELTSANAAARFGLAGKGDIAEGFDADIALLDPDAKWTIHGADSFSAQGYTPFENLRLTGRVQATFVRGSKQFEAGKVTGAASGKYLKRPGR